MIEFPGNWGWWIAAGLLLIFELALPGVFFLWFALAAVVLGVVHAFYPLPFMAEIVLFGGLAVVFALVGRRYLARQQTNAGPVLNERQLTYVGRRYRLAQPIVDGRGLLTIDDTRWDIEGPDLAAGEWIEVTGADGTRLIVKAATRP